MPHATLGVLRNKAMILIAVLGVGALGYKLFWPDSEPMKAAAAATMPKMTAPKASGNANRTNIKSETTPRTKNNDDTTNAAPTRAAATPKTASAVARREARPRA